MKASATALLAAVLTLVLTVWAVSRPDQVAAQESQPQIYEKLRTQALHLTPADLGIKPMAGKNGAYGIVMDMGLSDGTATIVAYASGDASVYTSTGGALIGGGLYPVVQGAARGWVQSAQDHLNAFEATDSFPVPPDGQARFFILTDHGVFTADGAEDDLEADKSELSPLWHLGQQLLDRLRAIPTKPAN